MYFNTIGDFLHMGGYSIYVFGGFILTYSVFVIFYLKQRKDRKYILNQIKKRANNEKT